MKEGEDAKRKTYRALCVINKEFSIDWVKEKLEAITDLELAQHTPIRVLHRRADAKRLRTVYYMKVESPPMTSLPEGTVYFRTLRGLFSVPKIIFLQAPEFSG